MVQYVYSYRLPVGPEKNPLARPRPPLAERAALDHFPGEVRALLSDPLATVGTATTVQSGRTVMINTTLSADEVRAAVATAMTNLDLRGSELTKPSGKKTR